MDASDPEQIKVKKSQRSSLSPSTQRSPDRLKRDKKRLFDEDSDNELLVSREDNYSKPDFDTEGHSLFYGLVNMSYAKDPEPYKKLCRLLENAKPEQIVTFWDGFNIRLQVNPAGVARKSNEQINNALDLVRTIDKALTNKEVLPQHQFRPWTPSAIAFLKNFEFIKDQICNKNESIENVSKYVKIDPK